MDERMKRERTDKTAGNGGASDDVLPRLSCERVFRIHSIDTRPFIQMFTDPLASVTVIAALCSSPFFVLSRGANGSGAPIYQTTAFVRPPFLSVRTCASVCLLNHPPPSGSELSDFRPALTENAGIQRQASFIRLLPPFIFKGAYLDRS